jgi:hypothetical protein|tara:strand:+ start:459 stop:662 length:204 start_codon:yes stop_codon:yes gene_type:complete
MKLLRELPSKGVEDMFFEMCIKSKNGCNIMVGDKNYNVYVSNNGEYITTEFKLDYELTEEEFKKFKK